FFDFPKAHDVIFSRYPFPGKAHNDYWEDAEVFGHFINEVMEKKQPAAKPVPEPIGWAAAVSWVLPYVLCFVLIAAGTYLLYTALTAMLERHDGLWDTIRTVLAISTLISGVTMISRVPRLVKRGWYHVLAAGVFVLGAAAYMGAAKEPRA